MKNNIKKVIVLLFALVIIYSCSKWNETESINIEDKALEELYNQRDKDKWAAEDARDKENKEAYEKYLENLRAYKETDHPIMFGWFNAWDPDSPGPYADLTLVPDSVDVISIWGNWHSLSERKIKEMREVQSKGTKLLIGWIISDIGSGILYGRENWPKDDFEAIDAYAQAIVDSIAKYDYDGFDFDYEPSYIGGDGMKMCGNLVSCDQYNDKEKEVFFIKKIREKLDAYGEKVSKKMLFHINGSIHYVSPEAAPYIDRFVIQSYNSNFAACGDPEGIASRLNIRLNQIVFTETFQNNIKNTNEFPTNYALKIASEQNKLGGIGAFHINQDALDKDLYKNIRRAISIMNPPLN